MDKYIIYIGIFIFLFFSEIIYFRIAKRYGIFDKPNERSSHSSIILRGGGIIFFIGVLVWSCLNEFQYSWFLMGLMMVALVSFVDDIKSLPYSFRLLIQFISTIFAFYQLEILHWELWWIVCLALIIYVGITNIINFMDGINGITAGYSLSVLIPLFLLNSEISFIDDSFIFVNILSVLVFGFFNFRPRGKAKCFAGDVGSISIAFILLFIMGRLILKTEDITYLILLVVYGIDACLTIVHRMFLHENLGKPHRKHVYQIMANELHLSHVKISLFYMVLQLSISFIYIYVVPLSIIAHWGYFIFVAFCLGIGYFLFIKKYYHLHESYLKSLK